ncbi:MAG: A/G-specific adenine glycosylase [Anaerolineales bacterium]|jgi:A/G-specific adenine glycosylase|nr:A/G-specific adenine glycosylase [Chloroflexota bacterium]MBK6647085.1 A/G-specific adenine glycosylase [Anaerolineales bacterium]
MPRLSALLLAWYDLQKRTLPWRDHPDPYAVWVSEIMCQQTRVETVIPYFEKWMKQFPSVKALASASEQDVLNAWEGLGYYSRARNLHKAAKVVVEKFGGKLPRDLDDLRSLPGIGRYTVGAIASLAFKMDEPTLDGNIRRVFSRLFDVKEIADSTAGEKTLWELTAKNLPKGRAGDYNQALMDLGAMVCLPKNPRCLICPLMKICKAREAGTQELRPVMKPKKQVPTYVHVAAVIVERGRALLSQRPANGLLGGMWEFPNARVDGDPARELVKALRGATRLKVQKKEPLGFVQHAYSHFRVIVYPFLCAKVEAPKDKKFKWVPLDELDDYPMGKVDRQIAKKVVGQA